MAIEDTAMVVTLDNEKFWTEVVKDFVDYYELQNGSRFLDVGCGKFIFMILKDFTQILKLKD